MSMRWVAAAVAAILIAQLASVGHRWGSRPPSGPTPEEAVVKEWSDANLAPDDVIAAVGNGQRVGYYARRPTVAVPSAMFTAQPWGLNTLHEAVRQYGIRIVVSSGEAGRAFFAAGIPNWLLLVHQSSEVRIFRVGADTGSRRENGGGR